MFRFLVRLPQGAALALGLALVGTTAVAATVQGDIGSGLAPVPAPATPVHGGVYTKEGCQLTVPSGWVASKSRVASLDKKEWAELMSAGSAAEIVRVETNLQAAKVSEDARVILMVSSASYGGLTNRQFHAITKTTPSCLADVTAPAGPMEAAAKAIALTIRSAR